MSTMILYLLFPLLIIGIEESQTANMTQEEPREVPTNQTINFSTIYNSTMATGNVTSSLDKDEKNLMDLLNNQTFTVITEDDENFQDQIISGKCNHNMLLQSIHKICREDFHKNMMTINQEDWCVLERITKLYSDLTFCMEGLSGIIYCPYPNSITQDFFVEIHSSYFHNCTREEFLFDDAPHWLVIVLTLIPVSLIPILIYMVVWKSKVQE